MMKWGGPCLKPAPLTQAVVEKFNRSSGQITSNPELSYPRSAQFAAGFTQGLADGLNASPGDQSSHATAMGRAGFYGYGIRFGLGTALGFLGFGG